MMGMLFQQELLDQVSPLFWRIASEANPQNVEIKGFYLIQILYWKKKKPVVIYLLNKIFVIKDNIGDYKLEGAEVTKG